MHSPLERDGTSTAVCVAGMHRCGTSFVAGALRFLGVSLGDPERLMPPGPDNPVGYFEIEAVMEFNEGLLAHLGGAWDQPPVLDPGWEQDSSLDPFRSRASVILDEVFGPAAERGELIGFKDPRLSLLLPFWRTVTPIATTIVLVRDPAEVAASLAARKYRVEGPQAASLWLRYLFAATANDPDHLVLRYRDLFDDLSGTLAAIARHIGVAPPDTRAEDAVRAHLEPSLRHHVAESSPSADNPLIELAVAVWNGGEINLDFVPPVVANGIARGWFRPPVDGELLARARADVVTLKESVRRLSRQRNPSRP
jgi:hypothetical protein